MKNLFVLSFLLLLFSTGIQAQDVKFGIKAGANFATLDGDSSFDSKNLTSYHAGGFVELNLFPKFSIQPELLYSSQGTKVDGTEDINLDYISIPVLAKIYLISDKLSLDVGPQFSFLVNDNYPATFESKEFDFAAIGGLGLNITESFFAQARYVVGLTDTTKDAEVTNKVIQLSVGLRF